MVPIPRVRGAQRHMAQPLSLQEKQFIAQLEEQLQAERKEIEVAWRGEGIGAA